MLAEALAWLRKEGPASPIISTGRSGSAILEWQVAVLVMCDQRSRDLSRAFCFQALKALRRPLLRRSRRRHMAQGTVEWFDGEKG